MSPEQQLRGCATFRRLPIQLITPGPERHYFGRDGLHPLAEKMAAFGLLEPIVVRRVGEAYEIVSGRRRWLAALSLGWRSIDAKIQNDANLL
jgi:ParB family chromosome partitioning protein